jgi:anti-sigma factor RsiW
MRCEECVPRLVELADGVLPAGDTRVLREHLAKCRICAERLRSDAEFVRDLRAGTDAPMPEDARERLARFLASLE